MYSFANSVPNCIVSKGDWQNEKESLQNLGQTVFQMVYTLYNLSVDLSTYVKIWLLDLGNLDRNEGKMPHGTLVLARPCLLQELQV